MRDEWNIIDNNVVLNNVRTPNNNSFGEWHNDVNRGYEKQVFLIR